MESPETHPDSTESQCVHLKLYAVVDRWLDESKVAVAMGDSPDTAEVLRECAEEIVGLLPPRGPLFHRTCPTF